MALSQCSCCPAEKQQVRGIRWTWISAMAAWSMQPEQKRWPHRVISTSTFSVKQMGQRLSSGVAKVMVRGRARRTGFRRGGSRASSRVKTAFFRYFSSTVSKSHLLAQASRRAVEGSRPVTSAMRVAMSVAMACACRKAASCTSKHQLAPSLSIAAPRKGSSVSMSTERLWNAQGFELL